MCFVFVLLLLVVDIQNTEKKILYRIKFWIQYKDWNKKINIKETKPDLQMPTLKALNTIYGN